MTGSYDKDKFKISEELFYEVKNYIEKNLVLFEADTLSDSLLTKSSVMDCDRDSDIVFLAPFPCQSTASYDECSAKPKRSLKALLEKKT